MKFLCGNCKAKYQIADAKVAGRTLRMKCRRCGHDILIQGENASGAPAPGARGGVGGSTVSLPPSPQRGPSSRMPPPPPAMPPPPSALGAGFRRGLAAPPEVPKRHVALDQWHVAIHDVPVGPMSREEMARKIAAGAVNGQSLCWREGMDDWRPLEEVPELAAVLSRGQGGLSGGVRAPTRHPAPVGGRMGASAPLSMEEFDDEFGEPTRVADMSASGGLAVPSSAGGAMAGGAMVGGAPPSSPVTLPPEPTPPPAQLPRAQMSPWALIGIGMLLAMGLLGGPFIVMRLLESPSQPAAQAAASPTPDPREGVEQAEGDEEAALEIDPEPEEEEVEAATNKRKPSRSTAGKSTPKKANSGGGGSKLSAEERALLERMGGGGSAPNNLGSSRSSSGSKAGGGPLKASQLRSVVTRNRPMLQRCYESALRATSSTNTVKVTVRLTVGISGTVTKASASGNGLGDMNNCIERSVRRWRFPSAGSTTQFEFPVVFQPGA